PGSKSKRTFSLSAIQFPPKRTRIRRRNGSTYNSLLGSGSGTRNRPMAPGDNGPCCHDSPMIPPPYRESSNEMLRRSSAKTSNSDAVKLAHADISTLFLSKIQSDTRVWL